MTERQRDIGRLVQQVQAWWTDQHAQCGPWEPDPLGRPFEGLGFLYGSFHEEVCLCPWACAWKGNRTSDQLVASLRPRLKAGAVEAAGLLSQPDVQVARQVASALLPQPFGDELTLVADLIQEAGAQTVQERRQALYGVGLSLIALGAFILFGRGSS